MDGPTTHRSQGLGARAGFAPGPVRETGMSTALPPPAPPADSAGLRTGWSSTRVGARAGMPKPARDLTPTTTPPITSVSQEATWMQACCHHQHPLPRCRRHLLRARRQWNALRHLFLLHWTLGLRASVLGIRPLPSTTRSVATRRLDCRWLLTAPIESSLPSAAPPPTSDARAPRKRPRDKAAPVYNKKRGRRALGCGWPPTSACGTKR